MPLLIELFLEIIHLLVHPQHLHSRRFLGKKVINVSHVRVIKTTVSPFQVQVAEEFGIVELFHLMRGVVSFHSTMDWSQKASMVNKFKEKISKFIQFRKFEFNYGVIVLFKER